MFVLEAIASHAKGERIALMNREETLSYRELDARSDAFAGLLLDRLGADRSPVVIYGHKETDFVPCMFGALKSGRAYVPIDTSTPPDRAMEIIGDVEPKLVVDFSGLLAADTGLLAADTGLLDGAALSAALRVHRGARVSPTHWITGGDTAYIIFTSGSTGRPKGVPITAGNLAHFYGGLLPYLKDAESGVILNQIAYSFDVSCCSLYGGIGLGMTLFTVDKAMVENMGDLFHHLGKSGLTHWVSTPSFAEICMPSKGFGAQLMPALRSFLFCGEVLTHKLCDGLAQRFPAARVINTYGPTEATVLVSAAEITEAMRGDARPIPIGRPIAGIELRIADESGRTATDDGATGELLILGDSVGPGYHRRPDLTEAVFFDDPETGRRGYRTGDIAYRVGDLYYYGGRMDNQLKLGGYRIELEDIENNLVRVDNIARAAVIPVYEGEKVSYLTAFVLLEQPDGLTPLRRATALKKQAADYLPAYMIPRKFVAVEAFPLTTSGKINRRALAKQLQEG